MCCPRPSTPLGTQTPRNATVFQLHVTRKGIGARRKRGEGAVAAAALRSGDWDVLILDLQLLQGTGLGVPYSVTSSARTRVDHCVLTMSSVSVRFVGSNCERPVWFRCRPYT